MLGRDYVSVPLRSLPPHLFYGTHVQRRQEQSLGPAQLLERRYGDQTPEMLRPLPGKLEHAAIDGE